LFFCGVRLLGVVGENTNNGGNLISGLTSPTDEEQCANAMNVEMRLRV